MNERSVYLTIITRCIIIVLSLYFMFRMTLYLMDDMNIEPKFVLVGIGVILLTAIIVLYVFNCAYGEDDEDEQGTDQKM